MPTYMDETFKAIQSLLEVSGRFPGGVSIGIPPAPPSTPAAAVFLVRGSAGTLTSTTSIRRREVAIRIYLDPLATSGGNIESDLEAAVYDTEQNVVDDLDLAGSGWALPGGEWEETYDYVDIGGKPFRVADLIMTLLYQE